MFFDINNNIIQKINDFNSHFQALDSNSKDSKIQDISNEILKDKNLDSSENKKKVVSLILDPLAREEVCSRIGINKLMPPKFPYAGVLGFSEAMSEEDKRTFSAIPSDKLAILAACAPLLYTNKMNQTDKLFIFRSLSNISKNNIKDVVQCLKLMNTQNWDLIHDFKDVPDGKLKNAVKYGPIFFKEGRSKVDLILAFSKINELEEAFPYAEMVGKVMELHDLVQTIKFLISLPENSRMDTAKRMQWVLGGMSHVETTEEEAILKYFKSVQFQGMEKQEKIQFLKQFLQGITVVPKRDLPSCLQSLPPVKVFRGLNSFALLFILPEQYRARFAENPQRIVDIPEFRKLLWRLLDENLAKSYLKPHIVALAHIVFYEQEALGLLPNDPIIDRAMVILIFGDKQKKVEILKTLVQLSKGRQKPTFDVLDPSIIENAKPFIRKGMNIYEVAEVVGLFQAIPATERPQVARLALKISGGVIDWKVSSALLHAIFLSKPEERELKVEQAENFFTKEMTGLQKALILLSLNNKDLIRRITSPHAVNKSISENDFAWPSVPISSQSVFANTDLIIFKDDFKGILPLNGIKEKELIESENLLNSILAGKKNIKIDERSQEFSDEIKGCFVTLMTRPIGRNLIRKVVQNPSIPILPIQPGKNCQLISTNEEIVALKMDIHEAITARSTSKESKSYKWPLYIVLGHELIHVSHFPNLQSSLSPSEGMESYDNYEEQTTITGFKKNKDTGGDEWFDDENFFKEDAFDPLNERNLHAAFANAEESFYPRFGHRGDKVRKNIISSSNPLEEGYQYIVSEIKENCKLEFRKFGISEKEIEKLQAGL